MGVFKLYFQIARWLSHQSTEILLSESLERIAAQYTQYSYIGNRKTLSQLVLSIAEELYQQWLYRGQDLSSILDTPPSRNGVAWASWWYGRKDWQKDSGAFPDFVLACDPIPTFGNGAILELKDSRSTSIASFNSTLPTARKSITTLLPVVHESIQRYESLYETTCPIERDCFYLIRTGKGNREECRLSLVQGTFFARVQSDSQDALTFSVHLLHHKRNGTHVVVQMRKFDQD